MSGTRKQRDSITKRLPAPHVMLRHFDTGMSNAEIAERFGFDIRTVGACRRRLLGRTRPVGEKPTVPQPEPRRYPAPTATKVVLEVNVYEGASGNRRPILISLPRITAIHGPFQGAQA